MTPKVIKTAAEHQAALAHAESLMDAAPGSPAEAELGVWGLLIEKFEEDHFPIDRPDPIDAIRFRMEQLGLSQSDLLRYIPSKSKVSEVLNRHRPLSLTMIRLLQAGLNIPAEVLIQESRRLRVRSKFRKMKFGDRRSSKAISRRRFAAQRAKTVTAR